MGIGLKTIQKKTKIKTSLNIHINENWITYCKFENNLLVGLNKITFLDKKKPARILKSIKKYLKSTDFNRASLNINLIYYNKYSSLTPTLLYDNKYSLSFLKYNSRVNSNDFVATDLILNKEITNLFIPYIDINNYIFKKFKTFDFFHYSSLLIEFFNNEISELNSEKLFLNVNDGFFDLVFFKNKKLKFYNSFEFSKNEDLLYFLIYCLNELNLNTENIHLLCYGNITLSSSLYELLYNYIKNIEIIKLPKINSVRSDILKSNVLLRLEK